MIIFEYITTMVSLKSIIDKLNYDDLDSMCGILNTIMSLTYDELYVDANLDILLKFIKDSRSSDQSINNYLDYLNEKVIDMINQFDINSKYRNYKLQKLLCKVT